MPQRSVPDNGQRILSDGEIVGSMIANAFITHDHMGNINMPAAIQDMANAVEKVAYALNIDENIGMSKIGNRRDEDSFTLTDAVARVASAGQAIAASIDRLADVLAQK
jgi:hypothetical protein